MQITVPAIATATLEKVDLWVDKISTGTLVKEQKLIVVMAQSSNMVEHLPIRCFKVTTAQQVINKLYCLRSNFIMKQIWQPQIVVLG